MLIEELGARIRSRRERLGLKQQVIANALQVSPQAVSKWERGENAPDISILGTLAKLLDVSTDWLLDTYGEGLDVFEATVFASSVTGAYKKSLQMDPRDFAAWVNGFLSQLTEAVLRHDGVPIKYVGDGFLCFFSGADHELRAAKAAVLAKQMVGDTLQIGLSSGPIYLGAVGHSDYSRPDIMGEVVNIAFLTVSWSEANTHSGLAATSSVVGKIGTDFDFGPVTEVSFKGISVPVEVCELCSEQND